MNKIHERNSSPSTNGSSKKNFDLSDEQLLDKVRDLRSVFFSVSLDTCKHNPVALCLIFPSAVS